MWIVNLLLLLSSVALILIATSVIGAIILSIRRELAEKSVEATSIMCWALGGVIVLGAICGGFMEIFSIVLP